MTPEDKAIELVNKFNHFRDNKKKEYIIYQDPTESIRCALIAVNEIIDTLTIKNYSDVNDYEYWQEVKQEIENL
jgi:hypothetical protein